MAILTFPSSPTDGVLYPSAPLPGQNQYKWEQATNTWRLVGTATGVTPGIYGSADNIPQITVDVTGRITLAADVPIGQYYVKTNNNGAYNSYVWPNADGGPGDFLQTDGSGGLSWVNIPTTNYWKLVGGNTLVPIANGYELALTDPAGNTTFFADNTGIVEMSAPGGAGTFIQFSPSNLISAITAASSATAAEPLLIQGSDLTLAAYGNSLLNVPATVTLTQSALTSDVNIATDGSIIVNAGTANSFATPLTRGTTGQFLISNGDGTTTWITSPFSNYWQRNGTDISPAVPGDTVEVTDVTSIPRVVLDPTGKVRVVTGLQSLTLDSNAAPNTTSITSVANTTDPGNLTISGNAVSLQAWGNSYTNPLTTLSLTNTGILQLKTFISAVDTVLFEVDGAGNLSTGRYIDSAAPSLFVNATDGNTVIGGRLTVNAGVPSPGSLNSYSFPTNRGVKDYALFTNADGSTRWDNINSVTGYWSQAISGGELLPSTPGQSVWIRDAASVNAIILDSDGWIRASGGDANSPTYGFVGNRTGFYGGLTEQINIGINGVLAAKFDTNFFRCYKDINFIGASTNAGADAILENTNTELLFSASTSSSVPKDIVFENFQNNEVARFTDTGNFIVDYGNAAIGSTTVTTKTNAIVLSIGDNAANQSGLLKLYSIYNGGDGFELFQDPATGTVEFQLNSTASPTLQLTTAGADVDGNLTVTGNAEVQGNFRVSSPTVPSASTSAGNTGEIAWDANFIYVCIAPNTWRRSPLATW